MQRIPFAPCRLAFVAAIVLGTTPLAAAAGITVSGQGSAKALPDVAELTATVNGNAELAGDAIEKYRGSKRLVGEALGNLKIDGITIQGTGLAVNSGSAPNMMAVMQGQGDQQKVAEKVAVEEQLTISLAGVDKLEADKLIETITRVIDTAKDAGLTLGPGPLSVMQIQFAGGKPSSLARFKLSKPEELRTKAYAEALQQARSKAEHLAKLAGVQLGEIVSIRELGTAAKSEDGNMPAYMALIYGQASGAPDDSSPQFKPISVVVNLEVEFAIK